MTTQDIEQLRREMNQRSLLKMRAKQKGRAAKSVMCEEIIISTFFEPEF